MAEARSVVITGAARGLGLATAIHLYRQGWHVIGAMRTPDDGLGKIRAATLARTDDPRLTGVRLDLTDPTSVAEAADAITRTTGGAPFGLVHNAGIVSVGCVDEMPMEVFENIFGTNILGAARLTASLLPGMRAAGRGRIVVVSSEAGIHGMPAISAYSASKGALERWAEALSLEIAPFGIGVSVLVAGTFKTDVLDHDHTVSYGNPDGPYRHLHAGQARLEGAVNRFARAPDRFAPAVERALEDTKPFARRAVGPDAVAMRIGRAVLPAGLFQRMVSVVLQLPRPGSLRNDPIRLAPTIAPSDDGDHPR